MIYDKIREKGFSVFYREKLREREKKIGGRGGHSSSHNINITDGYTNGYYRRVYFVGNTVCKHDALFFPIIVPSAYNDKIVFVGVY